MTFTLASQRLLSISHPLLEMLETQYSQYLQLQPRPDRCMRFQQNDFPHPSTSPSKTVFLPASFCGGSRHLLFLPFSLVHQKQIRGARYSHRISSLFIPTAAHESHFSESMQKFNSKKSRIHCPLLFTPAILPSYPSSPLSPKLSPNLAPHV